MFIRTAHQW